MGRVGWPRDPGQAGLLEAEGAGAAGVRQGSPPQSGIHSDSDGASAEQRGGGGRRQTARGAKLLRGEGKAGDRGNCSLQKGDEWGETHK